MKKKKPEIRFNGFEGEWEIKELRDVVEFAKGKGYSKGDLTKEGIPIIRYGSLYTDYRTEINSVSEYVQYSEGAIFSRGGEVIIPASGETSEDIARASAVKQPNVILGGDLNIIYPNAEIDAVFLALEITYGKSHTYLAMKAQGASVVHLRKLDISTLSPKFPSLPEQEKIGLFLTTLDKLITKLEAKLDKLRKLKQALLEKMFANVNGGYETPEIRFKGYTDKWQVKELGEVAIFNPPNQPLKELFYYIDLESVEKGFLKIKEQVTKRMAPSRAQRTLEFNDILFQTVRPYLQNHYLFKKNTQNNQWVASTGYALLRPKIYPELLYTMLLSKGFMQEVMQRCTGSTYPAINSKKMADIKVGCSSVQMEQQLIGDLFILLDNQLNKTSTKLTKLRNIKQSLLQKMFA